MRWLLLGSVVLLAGCFTESPPVLEDTLGLVVGWSCDDGPCAVVPRLSTLEPPVCGERDRWVVGAGAIAIVCAASEDGEGLLVHESTCRPLACADELDCPQWDELHYGCDAGMCTTGSLGLDPLDVRAACLRLVPRRSTCEAQDADVDTIDRTALAASACPGGDDTRCEIPEACQP